MRWLKEIKTYYFEDNDVVKRKYEDKKVDFKNKGGTTYDNYTPK